MKKIFLYDEMTPWLDLSDFQHLTEDEPVTVFVNSPGGDVSIGLSIFNLLSRVKDLTICIDGIAASAASLLAFLPNAKVKMNSNSFLFLHLPSVEMCGAKRADDLLRIASELEKMGGSILDIYIQKAKCSREELEKMLEAETLLTAQESLELGFCDEIIETASGAQMKNFSARFVAKIDELKKKKNESEAVLQSTRQQAFADGVKAERQRLQEIDELVSGFPEFADVIRKEKFSDGKTAGDIALLILKEQKKQRDEQPRPVNLISMYQALNEDAKLCEIDGEPAAVDSEKKSLSDLVFNH